MVLQPLKSKKKIDFLRLKKGVPAVGYVWHLLFPGYNTFNVKKKVPTHRSQFIKKTCSFLLNGGGNKSKIWVMSAYQKEK